MTTGALENSEKVGQVALRPVPPAFQRAEPFVIQRARHTLRCRRANFLTKSLPHTTALSHQVRIFIMFAKKWDAPVQSADDKFYFTFPVFG